MTFLHKLKHNSCAPISVSSFYIFHPVPRRISCRSFTTLLYVLSFVLRTPPSFYQYLYLKVALRMFRILHQYTYGIPRLEELCFSRSWPAKLSSSAHYDAFPSQQKESCSQNGSLKKCYEVCKLLRQVSKSWKWFRSIRNTGQLGMRGMHFFPTH